LFSAIALAIEKTPDIYKITLAYPDMPDFCNSLYHIYILFSGCEISQMSQKRTESNFKFQKQLRKTHIKDETIK
jgi:hypothetical protein